MTPRLKSFRLALCGPAAATSVNANSHFAPDARLSNSQFARSPPRARAPAGPPARVDP